MLEWLVVLTPIQRVILVQVLKLLRDAARSTTGGQIGGEPPRIRVVDSQIEMVTCAIDGKPGVPSLARSDGLVGLKFQ